MGGSSQIIKTYSGIFKLSTSRSELDFCQTLGTLSEALGRIRFCFIYDFPQRRWHATDDDAEKGWMIFCSWGGRCFEMRQFSTVHINSYKSDKSSGPGGAPGAGIRGLVITRACQADNALYWTQQQASSSWDQRIRLFVWADWAKLENGLKVIIEGCTKSPTTNEWINVFCFNWQEQKTICR